MQGICVKPALQQGELLLAVRRDESECHFLVDRGRDRYRVLHRMQLFPYALSRSTKTAPDEDLERREAVEFYRGATERYLREEDAFPKVPRGMPGE